MPNDDLSPPDLAPPPVSVSVLGLGALGGALAQAFVNAGHRTTVWNRSAGKSDHLVAIGAVRADTVAEAVSASSLVVLAVSTYDVVRAVLDPVGDALAGRSVVNLSSGTPEQAREMATWVASRGAGYLDGAAMSGTRLVGQAEALFLYSGVQDAFEAHRQTLASLGHAMNLGVDPGVASLYDTALLGLNMGVLSGFYHAAALVGSAGVDAQAFAEVATGYLPFVNGLLAEHASQIDAGRYPEDDGTVEVLATAMDHVVHTSQAANISAEVPEGIRSLLDRAVAAGHGGAGVASLIEVIGRPGS